MVWNVDTSSPYATGRATLPAVLDDAAERAADTLAIVRGDDRVSYDELRDTSVRIATALHGLGVRKGDRIAVYDTNSATWLAFFYGACRLGAVTVPVHTRYRPEEVGYVLSAAKPVLIAVGERYVEPLRAALGVIPEAASAGAWSAHSVPVVTFGGQLPGAIPFPVLAETRGDPQGFASTEVSPDDLVLLKYTSGSTGFPKGVMLAHGPIIRNGFNVGERLGMQPGDRLFSPLPFFHSGGTILSICTAATQTSTLVTLDYFSAENAVDAVHRHACTIHIGLDVMYLREVAASNFSADRMRSVRAGWFGGSAGAAVALAGQLPFPFTNLYGMTELSGNTCMTRLDDPDELRLTTAGEPQPGIEIGIFDPDSGERLPPGRTGLIRARGWCAPLGYWSDPAATGGLLRDDGWIETGDLGWFGPEGYLRFVGRAKAMLKVGGENVSVPEVEGAIQTHPSVKLAQVVGVPDPDYDEAGFAFVELRPGCQLGADELREFLAGRMARFKVPRHVRFVRESDWPLTGPEKIQRGRLREMAVEILGIAVP